MFSCYVFGTQVENINIRAANKLNNYIQIYDGSTKLWMICRALSDKGGCIMEQEAIRHKNCKMRNKDKNIWFH